MNLLHKFRTDREERVYLTLPLTLGGSNRREWAELFSTACLMVHRLTFNSDRMTLKFSLFFTLFNI